MTDDANSDGDAVVAAFMSEIGDLVLSRTQLNSETIWRRCQLRRRHGALLQAVAPLESIAPAAIGIACLMLSWIVLIEKRFNTDVILVDDAIHGAAVLLSIAGTAALLVALTAFGVRPRLL
ncbi:MAG: hypothetical protein HC850_16395 [Rhodomicrobium sp.]|nr:hypothetical protein [Rhodomicrobium sp.]